MEVFTMISKRVPGKGVAVYSFAVLLVIASFGSITRSQVIATSRITGTVTDPNGALIPNAQVVVKNNETGNEYKTKSSDEGVFVVASLPVAVYTVTITAQGFKQTVIPNVKTEVGQAATVEVKLEVGAADETVTVTGGAEVLQKDSTNVGSVISGRQITELPFTSRDALDLVLTLPGTATVGRPRSSSVNGLPKGALFISMDGINSQDNFLRTTDGFFTYIRPRIDAIEEVQVSTATPGAEASAGGAVHIRFVTKAGTNQYHGGGWWYNRQRAYNANYFFNNLTGIERAQVMVNQWGFKIGGPLTPWLKDRAFFFLAYDEFRLPEQTVRTRTILSPDAARGIFKYPGGPANGVDVLGLVASRNIPGAPGTIDPLISKILADIRTSTAAGSVKNQTDPNFQSFTFTNTGGQTRKFPTLRVDINVSDKHHVEAIYNYQEFRNMSDFLNNADPAFPNPVPQIFGAQNSNRFSFSTALRSQLSATVVNEARFGLTGGTVVFRPTLSAADFDVFGGIAPSFNAFSGVTVSNPYTTTTFSRRNSPIQQFTENLSWAKGPHNFNFGGAFTHTTSFQQSSGGSVVPTLAFGASSAADPVSSVFNSTTLPGADVTQLANARALYALLTGRISGVTFNGKLDEETKKYSDFGTAIERNSVIGFGIYFQDYFKFRPNLSINYGLRWEFSGAPRHNNNVYVRPTGLFGISGQGNLFNPNANAGAATTYVAVDKDTKPFDDDANNLAPSIGISWSPKFEHSLLKRIFGEGDKTVFRGAYAISYVSGGFADFNGIWNGNPGLSSPIGARAGTEFPAGSLLLRDPAISEKLLRPLPTLSFPIPASVGIPAFDFDPNLTAPYVQSWNFSIQRELTKDMVFEARYVANHSIGLGQTLDLNEVNIFENGFLNEFIAAQKNLAISIAAGRGSNFRNQGLAGQVALPIFEKSFASATSTQFASSTFTTPISRGEAGSVAQLLGNNSSNSQFQTNRVAAGLSANFFITNPSVLGGESPRNSGAFLATNGGSSTYNALQLELRRRLSGGLVVNGNYTWSHALTNLWPSFQNAQGGTQPHTLRDPKMDRGPSNFDIRHAFKVSYTYELPFGAGHRFDYRGRGGIIGKILEGWETDGIVRWQSGRHFPLVSGRGTVNQFDSGVVLVGMSAKELQSLAKIRKDGLASTRGTVFWLPDDVILNTQRAFGLRPGETPTGRYIAPPTTPGKFGSFIFLHGPSFFRADLSVVKRTRITERTNVEFRAEFLDAFNTVNFLIGNTTAGNVSNSDSYNVSVNNLTFGQTNHAYQDVSTTNDPGGRLIQLVLRINF
jgi:Carboxypeptidase regulatory-like domain